MARRINLDGIDINTNYSIFVGLGSWSRKSSQVLDLAEDPRAIVFGLEEGKNLFELLPAEPSSKLREKLMEPMSPDEPGLSPEFYGIEVVGFKSIDWLILEGRKFYAESPQQIGPYFCPRSEANPEYVPKRFGITGKIHFLNSNQLVSQEVDRITSAILRSR